MSSQSLRETLRRVAEWERYHQPKIPQPHRPDLHSAEERVADSITTFAGSMRFVYLHTAWFGLWIVVNLGLLGAALGGLLQPFDPYPFGLLTMVVSLEAIFLSAFVMISQNRQAAVADRRAAMDYEVNLRAEAEISKLVTMVEALVEHHAELAVDPAGNAAREDGR